MCAKTKAVMRSDCAGDHFAAHSAVARAHVSVYDNEWCETLTRLMVTDGLYRNVIYT